MLLNRVCILITAIICIPFTVDAKTSLRDLALEEQKESIQDAVNEISKVLPVQLDETITWQRMYYVKNHPVLGGIYLSYTADIAYENVDEILIPSVKKKLQNLHINSVCANDTYKQFIFVTKVPVRIVYKHTTGQELVDFIIDKNTCIDAGYKYP